MNRTEGRNWYKEVWRILFFLYCLLVIKLLIFKYPYMELKLIMDNWEKAVILEGLDTANFVPLKTIKMYIHYAYKLNSFENLVGNVAVFMPFGYLLPCISRKSQSWITVLCKGFLFSTAIELFQLFSAFGAFDVDDLLLNSFGVLLGYLLYAMNKKLFE